MKQASTPDLSFWDHLEELRARIIRSLYAIGIGFFICFSFADRIFEVLMAPLHDIMPAGRPQLYFTGLLEPIMTHMQIGLVAGLFLASPFIFYQIWAFIAPGLYNSERRFVLPLVVTSTIFFVGGALFGYFWVFPAGFKFFLSFSNENLQPMLTIAEYYSLATKMLFIFGLVFETPVAIFFLAYLRIVDARFFFRHWRYAIVVISIASAILTPADAFTMVMMMLPLLALYFMSAGFALLVDLGRRPKETAQESIIEE